MLPILCSIILFELEKGFVFWSRYEEVYGVKEREKEFQPINFKQQSKQKNINKHPTKSMGKKTTLIKRREHQTHNPLLEQSKVKSTKTESKYSNLSPVVTSNQPLNKINNPLSVDLRNNIRLNCTQYFLGPLFSHKPKLFIH